MAYDEYLLNKKWDAIGNDYYSNTCLMNKDGDELTCSNGNARQISKKQKSATVSNRITTQQNTMAAAFTVL